MALINMILGISFEFYIAFYSFASAKLIDENRIFQEKSDIFFIQK